LKKNGGGGGSCEGRQGLRCGGKIETARLLLFDFYFSGWRGRCGGIRLRNIVKILVYGRDLRKVERGMLKGKSETHNCGGGGGGLQDWIGERE